MKKSLRHLVGSAASVAALVFGLLTPLSAEARWHGYGWHGYHHGFYDFGPGYRYGFFPYGYGVYTQPTAYWPVYVAPPLPVYAAYIPLPVAYNYGYRYGSGYRYGYRHRTVHRHRTVSQRRSCNCNCCPTQSTAAPAPQ